jgi:hypothetical protein
MPRASFGEELPHPATTSAASAAPHAARSARGTPAGDGGPDMPDLTVSVPGHPRVTADSLERGTAAEPDATDRGAIIRLVARIAS